MQLTDHFTLAEFTRSGTADNLGLDNTPNTDELANLLRLAQVLEVVRVLLGSNPIVISSGFRSDAVNRAVRGVPNSDHRLGLAVDFTCKGFGSPLAVCRRIASSTVDFEQLIYEQTWVHLAIAQAGEKARREILTAHFSAGPTRYTQGLPATG